MDTSNHNIRHAIVNLPKPPIRVFGSPNKPPSIKPGPAPLKAREPTPQLAFAEWILSHHRERFRWEEDENQQHRTFFEWTGTHWKLFHPQQGVSMAAEWLQQNAPDKTAHQTAVNGWALARSLMEAKPEFQLHKPRANVVPLKSCYLELTRQGIHVRAIDPAFCMRHVIKLDVAYPVGTIIQPATLPSGSKLARFLAHALPVDVQGIVQELLGQTLLTNNYQIAGWFYGAAGSGKSTLIDLCAALHQKVAAINLNKIGDSFSLEGLLGASLALADEVDFGKWPEATFKAMVSQNATYIERKGTSNISVRPSAKWLISSNQAPFIRDQSDGVWRRLCLIPFMKVIPETERVEGFHNVLLKEEPALVLEWLLAGAIRLIQRGRFLAKTELPASLQEAQREIRAESNTVLDFVQTSALAIHEGAELRGDTLFNAYSRHCEGKSEDPLPQNLFFRTLRTVAGFEALREIRRVRVGNLQTRVFPLAFGPAPTNAEPFDPDGDPPF